MSRSISERIDNIGSLRSPPFAFLPETLDHVQHLPPPSWGIEEFATHAHADFVLRIDLEQLFQQQMLHLDAHIDAAVARIMLLWGILQIDELHWLP